jgi:hypothetical protein
MRHLRHGLYSLALAVSLLAVAVLSGWDSVAGAPRSDLVAGVPRPELAAGIGGAAGEPNEPAPYSTLVTAVVCDEGMPADTFCPVPVRIPVPAPTREEANTYDRRAIAGEDTVPHSLSLEVSERSGYVEVRVELIDDAACEPPEDFLLVVLGPEIEVITPVIIVDKDC